MGLEDSPCSGEMYPWGKQEEEYLDERASYLHRYEAANQNLQAKRAAHIS